ncbi:MAG: hypothetical protein HQK49_18810 [Oligoflexia bacterium]|nr:hypothetical protein [Oligoflexia bacterium]
MKNQMRKKIFRIQTVSFLNLIFFLSLTFSLTFSFIQSMQTVLAADFDEFTLENVGNFGTCIINPRGMEPRPDVSKWQLSREQNWTIDIVPSEGQHLVEIVVDGVSFQIKDTKIPQELAFNANSGNHTIIAKCAREIVVIRSSIGPSDNDSTSEYYKNCGTFRAKGGEAFPCERTINVAKGDDKIIAYYPDAGYIVYNVIVDGKTVGATTSYQFKNLQTAHAIHATFKKVSR